MSMFEEFQPNTQADWKAAVDRELKGKPIADYLEKNDPIEGLEFSKFDSESAVNREQLSYTRASGSQNNDWRINQTIIVRNEKAANQQALKVLNMGADSLTFLLTIKQVNWSELFDNIGLDYIETQFKTCLVDQADELKEIWPKYSKKQLVLLDGSIGHSVKGPEISINSYDIHLAGGNAIQEITYCLSKGHDQLANLLNMGISIVDASAAIRFEMGIGAHYFVEIAKFRVLRKLWSNIVAAYEPQENCSHACYLYARSGFVNKSLKDPYTNLLRQTTEAVSAVIGGANEIDLQPYDRFSNRPDSELATRMAINISHLLKEESYLNQVVDPIGGSYSIERLCHQIETKAWEAFKKIEATGGLDTPETTLQFQTEIQATREKRIAQIKSGESPLIGVNLFPNPDQTDLTWKGLPVVLGMPMLNLEMANS